MASADFKQRYVTLVELVVMSANEVREQHPLGRPLNQDRGVGEEQVGVLSTQVTRDENLGEINDRRNRHFSYHSRREPPEIAKT